MDPRAIAIREILKAVLVVAVVVGYSRAPADPDLWGHVRYGQDMLAGGPLLPADHYSFTSDRPWLNHEWLAEIVMALAFDRLGASGLNLLRLSVTLLALAIVWLRIRDTGTSTARFALLTFTALGILTRALPIRPQLFSILLFAALLGALSRSDVTRAYGRLTGVIPLMMAVWVNLHGGWLVGLGVLLFWGTWRLVTERRNRQSVLAIVACLALGSAATLANPYGLGMWRFMLATIGPARPFISDWQPIYTVPIGLSIAWIVSVGVIVVVLAWARQQVDPAHVAIAVLLAVASFRISRLDAFLALAVVVLIGPTLLRQQSKVSEPARDSQGRWRPYALAATALVAAAVLAARLPIIEVKSPLMPEPEAAQFARSRGLSGRMLTWFDWGQYAIWHLGPRVQVSMDGRRETVYSEQTVKDHFDFYRGLQGSTAYADRIAADYVWLPKQLIVVQQLQALGWRPLFVGPVSIILSRGSGDVPGVSVIASAITVRPFPNP